MRTRLITLAILLVVAAVLAVSPGHALAADPPTVTSVTPNTAGNGGGTVISVYGTNFQTGAYVSIGGVLSSNVSVVSPNMLTAVTPAGNVGPAQLSVINPDGQSASSSLFSYTASTAAPTSTVWVAGINPPTGPVGQVVHITGSGFDPNAIVFFGGIAAEQNVWISSTYMMSYPPNGSGTVAVMVVNPNGQSATAPSTFTYTSGGTATTSSVSITSIAPAAASGGTGITIIGAGFVSGATVRFGGYPATNVNVITGTLITATAPVGPTGIVDVVVTNTNGTAATFPGFSFGGSSGVPGQPSVASVSPSSGVAGTTVSISGSGFAAPSTVMFGGVPATSVNVVNANLITATVPANPLGAVTVLVSGPTGAVGGLSAGFTYGTAPVTASYARMTSVSPTSGSMSGGTTLAINGSGFTSGATVTVGGVPASVISASDAQIYVTAPPAAAGTATILVTNPGGSITGLANAYTYTAAVGAHPSTGTGALAISGVTPSSGPSAGGTSIVINGSGFQTGATVTISGINVTATVLSSTQIAAASPAVTGTGSVTVTVTNPGGGSASLPSAFTYTADASTGGSAGGGSTGGSSGPVPAGGGLFVFGGGTNAQLVTASGCTTSNAAFWTTSASGAWVGYVPSIPIPAVNAAWNTLFPTSIPAGTPIFARC